MDYHRAALMLIRLSGAVYALMGVVWMISSLVLIVATAFGPTLVLHLVGGSLYMFLVYGLMYLLGGLLVIWAAPRLAKFAAKL
jgi:hypothetical protein